MQTDFVWNDPYTDVGARNVTDGSLDYYDFQWGSSAKADPENERPAQPGCCCPDRGETITEAADPDVPGYEIIAE